MVTLTITKFLWAELNRVIQEELVDAKFDDFEEGRFGIAILQSIKGCKNAYISYGDNGRFISLVLETQAF